jgi:hypothetical protein
LYFVKHSDSKALFLAVVTLPFAFQFRPESGLILILTGLTLILMAPKEMMRQRFYAFLLLLLALSLPHLVHLYCVRFENWGAPVDSSKFALAHFYKNIIVNGPFYFVNKRFPLIVTLLALAGFVLPLPRFKREPSAESGGSFFCREKVIVASWFFLFWGIFVFFYAGSYNYGADVRFSLLSQMPLALIGGFGASRLSVWVENRCAMKNVTIALSVLIVISFLSFMPYIRAATQEAWSSRFDHRFAKKIAETVPPHSLIFTHNPNMFLVWGKNAAQSSIAMSKDVHLQHFFKKYTGGVYFHYNYWCSVASEAQPTLCKNILEKFNTEKILWESEKGKEYALYRLELRK